MGRGYLASSSLRIIGSWFKGIDFDLGNALLLPKSLFALLLPKSVFVSISMIVTGSGCVHTYSFILKDLKFKLKCFENCTHLFSPTAVSSMSALVRDFDGPGVVSVSSIMLPLSLADLQY